MVLFASIWIVWAAVMMWAAANAKSDWSGPVLLAMWTLVPPIGLIIGKWLGVI